MAIPFYEPKSNESINHQQHQLQQQQQQNLLLNASVDQNYDQVDGIGVPPATTTMPISTFPTPPPTPPAAAAASATPFNIIFDGSTILMNTPTATPTPTTSTSSSTPAPPTPTPSFEQQAMAWKILAITMCKALKEYYLQTSSSKDAFTNQTVQILPNGDIQPLWK